MNRNAVYVGCMAGVALVATLFYPVYIVLPKLYVADWYVASNSLGLTLSAIALAFPVVGGIFAARRCEALTPQEGIRLGAVAGGVAGVVAFCALGAAAAGILALGVAQLSNGKTGMADTIILTGHYTYGVLWGTALGGTALGAFGGRLASPVKVTQKQPDGTALRIAEVLSIRLLLMSGLILVITLATLPGLLSSGSASQKQGMTLLFNEAVASGFAHFLAIQLWILRLARNRLVPVPDRTVAPKRSILGGLWFTLLLCAVTLVVMIIILLFGQGYPQSIESSLLLNPVFLVGILASLVVGSNILKIALGLFKELRAVGGLTHEESAQLKTESQRFAAKGNVLTVAIVGGAAIALPPLTLVPLAVNLARGVIPASAGGMTATIVGDLFRSQALAAYGAFLVGAVTIVCSVTIASGLSRFWERAPK